MATPLRVHNEEPKAYYPPYPPPMFGPPPPPPSNIKGSNFYTSGTSNEQLNIYLYPHQTLFTHNNYITYLSDKLTVEHLPPIQLPLAFNSKSTCFDYIFKCFTYCFVSICKCSLFGMGNVLSFSNTDSNFHNTRLVINNNNIKDYVSSLKRDPNSVSKAYQTPYICLSPSLQISSPHSFGKRNFISPTHDSSSISSSLSRKILSINLTAQTQSALIINVVNLFAYIMSDSTIYDKHSSAESLSVGQLMLDFCSPITPYKLAISATYNNDNNERLLSSLERVLSTVTRFRPNALNRNRNRNRNNNRNEISDLVSRRTAARAAHRKKVLNSILKQKKGYCCVDIARYLFLILCLALFPAVFILILMNQVLEEMSSDNTLPLVNTLCLVEMQCPHYRRSRRKVKRAGKKRKEMYMHNVEDDSIVFLESNGDIYHKYLGATESFYIRGECVIAFDKNLSSVEVCNYGQNGSNLREYRCKGDFIQFIGPGNLWYGNGKQDLLSNSYKLKSMLFCDNIKYADPNYIPNIKDVQQQSNNNNNNRNDRIGNYTNGRFGIIQSFELRQKYKIKFIEKCLILSTITLVFLSILLFVITLHLQPNFMDIIFNEINQFIQQFNFP